MAQADEAVSASARPLSPDRDSMLTAAQPTGAPAVPSDAAQREREREHALRDWEAQSLVATERPLVARRGALLAVGIAALAAGALVLRQWAGAEAPTGTARPQVTVAGRQAVPALAVRSSDAPREREPSAALTAVTAQRSAPVHEVGPGWDSQQREQEQAQQARLREARRKSSILLPAGAGSPAGTGLGPGQFDDASGRPGGAAADSLHGAGGMDAAAAADDADAGFARAASGQAVPLSVARHIGALPFKVLQGKMIEAVLSPRAVSGLPGTVCATVQRDVFGEQGRRVLIPWGSRVCGQYRAQLRPGQERLFIVWQTLRRPDGIEVALDSIGGDQLGSAGLAGEVDHHFAERFAGAVLVSILGVGGGVGGGGAVMAGVPPDYGTAAYRSAVQQAAADTSRQLLVQAANLAPSVTVPPGAPIRILINRDLDFAEVYGYRPGKRHASGSPDRAWGRLLGADLGGSLGLLQRAGTGYGNTDIDADNAFDVDAESDAEPDAGAPDRWNDIAGAEPV